MLLCHGTVYYELADRRAEAGIDDVALVRLEQCYPFPADQLAEQLARFGDAEVVWVQAEPQNMGAARFVTRNLRERLGVEARIVSRAESPSPATGSLTLHRQEQSQLLEHAFS